MYQKFDIGLLLFFSLPLSYLLVAGFADEDKESEGAWTTFYFLDKFLDSSLVDLVTRLEPVPYYGCYYFETPDF